MHQDPILRMTADGSPTLFSPDFQATYHSLHGALQESNHVFIEHGLHVCLDSIPERPIRIFEMGFGTGLNAWLTFISGSEKEREIFYHAVEQHPLKEDTIRLLHYGDNCFEPFDVAFRELHALPWNHPGNLSPLFHLLKDSSDVLEATLPNNIDLIYYDAFGPETQPALWTTIQLDRICRLLNTGGLFVTYCAKGAVRRSLIEIGMVVERLPGPPGKREMLRAQRR